MSRKRVMLVIALVIFLPALMGSSCFGGEGSFGDCLGGADCGYHPPEWRKEFNNVPDA